MATEPPDPLFTIPLPIRARQAYVIASAPPSQPDAVANAPVIIESRSAEAALSLDEDCADRGPRLRMLLHGTGQTDPFYVCFSDNGGTLHFSVTSGVKALDPLPEILVDPEPRLLRVRVLDSEVAPVDLFEVSAYNADRGRIAIPVDVTMADSTVPGVSVASLTLAGEENPATIVQALPLKEGTTALHAAPRLFDMPDCASPPVTVIPAPLPPVP